MKTFKTSVIIYISKYNTLKAVNIYLKIPIRKDCRYIMNLETANKLLRLRKQNNLSQEELAEKLGISRQAVSKWERAEASPDTDNLITLANLYRISLDELLDIDVKTMRSEEYQDIKSKVNLSKPEDTQEVPPQPQYKKVVYPKDSLSEELYNSRYAEGIDDTPNSANQSSFDASNYGSTKVDSIPNYQAENYIQPIPDSSSTNKKKKKKKRFGGFGGVPPYTSNGFILKFEQFMKKFHISYKGLYTFPYYAIAIVMMILCADIFWNGGYLAGFWAVSIPLYYTFVGAVHKRNPNIFGYPLLAFMLMLLSMFLGFDGLSCTWLATIPFYYWIVNKNKH